MEGEKGVKSVMDFLSGKSAVEAAKRSDPALFRTNLGKKVERKGKLPKVSALGSEVIANFLETNCKGATPGTSYDLDEKEVTFRYANLAAVLGDDNAAAAVRNAPLVMTVTDQRVRDNFAVYEEKWGTLKAQATVVRNPNILQVPTRGYGSAETSDTETVVISYLVAFTRPFGKPLLATLFVLLAYKPILAIIAANN